MRVRSACRGVSVCLAGLLLPLSLAAAPVSAAQSTASRDAFDAVHGLVRNTVREPLPDRELRLRDLSTGNVVATTRTNDAGEFTFAGGPAGSYVIEVAGIGGRVIAVSSPVLAGARSLVTGVVIVVRDSPPPFLRLLNSHLGPVLIGAAAAGITAAIVATRPVASPSR